MKNINMGKHELYRVDSPSAEKLPIFTSKVSAGFPSPADNYIEDKLDLNRYLIKHPSSTFFVKVNGDSMKGANINSGDILIVDKSLEQVNNAIAVCIIDGEFTVKKIRKIKNDVYLIPENPNYKPVKVTEYNDFSVWGIVTYIIHKT